MHYPRLFKAVPTVGVTSPQLFQTLLTMVLTMVLLMMLTVVLAAVLTAPALQIDNRSSRLALLLVVDRLVQGVRTMRVMQQLA
jgi:hypothetical protein